MSFLIALVVGAALTPALAAIGLRTRLVDHPGELKIHDVPVPITGGVAVVIAALAGLTAAARVDPWVAAAALLALGGGLVDDLRPTPPWVRLVVQGVAGALLVAGGLRLEPFGALGGAALVLATVACCNAVNMVDGQDGLAAGLGAIAAAGLAAVLATFHANAALPLAISGALVGFVLWNRPPARVYLGDGGAYAVGLLLAAASAQASSIAGWHGVLAAGASLGVLAYELVSTIARRAVSSSAATRGDRQHSYDRLAVRLGSRTGSTLAMWALGAACSLLGLWIVRLEPGGALLVVVAVTLAAVVLDVRALPVSMAREER